jgi:hypothetical protein
MFRQVHFCIPRLAIGDVSRAVSTLRAEVAKLLSEGADDNGFYFDSSEYFHLSYRLATAFPDLWESNLIRSYRSSRSPVRLLQSDQDADTNQDHAIFGSSLLAALFRRTAVVAGTMMLYFGTINIRMQKALITVTQPLIPAGICLMYYEMSQAKWIVIFPCLGLAMLFYYQLRHHFKAGSSGDGKIGVDPASIDAHIRQSRSFDRQSLRRTPQHDRYEEVESERRHERGVFGVEPEIEMANLEAEEEVRREEVVETLPGGVHEAHDGDGDDGDSNTDVDGEDGLSEDLRSGDVKFLGRISWESDSTEEPIAVMGEGEEGQKEYWFDGQSVWDEEEDEDEDMPNHLSLTSDDDEEELFVGFALRKRPRPNITAAAGGGDVGQKVQEGVRQIA